MANQWFRLYAEFASDPKVQVLTETLQRRYVMALCLQCNDYLKNRPDDEIALALRVTVEDWLFTKDEFIKRGLMDKHGAIHGWDKRQYISDLKDPTASERQKRYRERNKTKRDVTVTSRLPEQNRTETEQKYKAPIPANILKDFLKVRKAKRVGELTETAFRGIEKEASKAGISSLKAIEICCAKGWATFNSSWDWGKESHKKNGLAL